MKRYLKIFGFIAFALVSLTFTLLHEQWRDELQAWIIARDLSFPEMVYQMRYEGHFVLWSLLLKPFTLLGACLSSGAQGFWAYGGIVWMNLISWVSMLIAAWLLIFRSPFKEWAKFAILISYPMLYYFPAVSRCYALIPPLLFGLAILYPRQKERPFLYCILLGFLAHTHSYMEGMVAMLFLIFCYDQILKPWKTLSVSERKRMLGAASLTVLFVLLAFLQVLPAFAVRTDLSSCTYTLQRTLGALQETLIPIENEWFVWSYYGVLVLLLLGLVWRYYRSPNIRALFIFVGAIAWQIGFSVWVYPMMLQREYLFFFILIFVVWIIRSSGRALSIVLLAVSLLTLTRGGKAIQDLYKPYSNARIVAGYMERNIPKGSIVACDNLSKVISAYQPDYKYVSIETLKPLNTYGPQKGWKTEKIREFSESVMAGKSYFYVRSNIGIRMFFVRKSKLEKLYTISRICEDEVEPIQESYYLYKVKNGM